MRKTALGAGALVLALTLTACGGEDDGAAGTSGARTAAEQPKDSGSATAAMTVAAKKAEQARSAKVSMKITAPGMPGGEVETSGVMAWGPLAMDLTTELPGFGGADLPETSRVLWVDDTLYVDLGRAQSAEPTGKRWMKLDLGLALRTTEDEAERSAAAGGLDALNGQDPVQQLALLLSSPQIEHVGPARIDGVAAQRYRGTITVAEALEAGEGLEFLGERGRQQLVDTVKRSGIEKYTIEAWVDSDDLPVRIHTTMDTPQGEMKIVQKLSDYGTDVSVQAPPPSQVFDFAELLKGLAPEGV